MKKLKFDQSDFFPELLENAKARSYASEKAQLLFDEWYKLNIENAPTIYLTETFWSFENDEAFKSRAIKKLKAIMIEKIK